MVYVLARPLPAVRRPTVPVRSPFRPRLPLVTLHELNLLCRYNPEVLYNLLFQASAATLLQVAADPKHLGAQIGFLSILHTWGHCAYGYGDITHADGARWLPRNSG